MSEHLRMTLRDLKEKLNSVLATCAPELPHERVNMYLDEFAEEWSGYIEQLDGEADTAHKCEACDDSIGRSAYCSTCMGKARTKNRKAAEMLEVRDKQLQVLEEGEYHCLECGTDNPFHHLADCYEGRLLALEQKVAVLTAAAR